MEENRRTIKKAATKVTSETIIIKPPWARFPYHQASLMISFALSSHLYPYRSCSLLVRSPRRTQRHARPRLQARIYPKEPIHFPFERYIPGFVLQSGSCKDVIHPDPSYDPMSSVVLEIDAAPKFAFLALPPPPKKKRATVNNTFRTPASPVNRSNTILARAETVHPGSPTPMTPAPGVSLPLGAPYMTSPCLHAFRRSSLARAGSCRQSVSSTRSWIPSASFLCFADTPRTLAHPIPATPLPADPKFDFVAFGHAPIFVDVPGPPPSPLISTSQDL